MASWLGSVIGAVLTYLLGSFFTKVKAAIADKKAVDDKVQVDQTATTAAQNAQTEEDAFKAQEAVVAGTPIKP